MLLRTLAGRYAGEIREYPFHVGQDALRSGTAARLDDPPPAALDVVAAPVPAHADVATLAAPAPSPRIAGSRHTRRRSR